MRTGGNFGETRLKLTIRHLFEMENELITSICREEYQGLKPPNNRTEDNFDAGAIFHVHAHVEYLR